MARRGNGEGTIRQRSDGRWEAMLRLPNGGRKSFFAKTRREVAEKLTFALRARQQGVGVVSDRETVAGYLTSWIASARPSLRPRTWQRYEQLVRVHAIPELGRIRLSHLGPADLQQLYAHRLSAGAAPTSVHHPHAVLHRALRQATGWGLVVRNVADLVKPPRITRREMTTLSPDQARALLDAVAGDRLEAVYVVGLTTGMRQGELLGLRWADVDLDARSARVRTTLHRTRDGFTFAAPKTARSRRQIALTPTAVGALRRHRARQIEDRLRAGAAWEDHDLVFANAIGQPLHGTYVTTLFRQVLARASLPRIRFHDLRHTAATLLLGRGVHPKIASEMLGHSTIAITLDLYSHVTPTMQREAVDALEAVFTSGRGR